MAWEDPDPGTSVAPENYDAPEGRYPDVPVPERGSVERYNPQTQYQYQRDARYQAATGQRPPGPTSGSVVTDLNNPYSYLSPYDQAQANRDALLMRYMHTIPNENPMNPDYFPPNTGPQNPAPSAVPNPDGSVPLPGYPPVSGLQFTIMPPTSTQSNPMMVIGVLVLLAILAFGGYKYYQKMKRGKKRGSGRRFTATPIRRRQKTYQARY